MAFIHYRTKGFIFKQTERFEADKFFTIFTYDFGRLEISAKAIRKITSKLRSGIDLFYLSEIEFIQGKTHKTLTDAIALEKFNNIRKDLKKLKLAFKIIKVLDDFLRFEEKDEKIWDLITGTFEKLNSRSGHQWLFFYFLWNFFSVLGYGPELYNCSSCQKKLTPDNIYFSVKEGGVICKNCARQKRWLLGTNSDVVKILRIILKNNWQTLSKLKIGAESENLLKNISKGYCSYLLTFHLSSKK